MNYDDDSDDATAPGAWHGFDWAGTGPGRWEEMVEALSEHDCDVPEAQAALVYLEEVDGVLDDNTVYTAAQIAALFKGRIEDEYENWAKIAEPWIDEHYPGLLSDPLVRDAFGASITEWEDELGRVLAGADQERYWWHETDGGTVMAVLRPGHTKNDQEQR